METELSCRLSSIQNEPNSKKRRDETLAYLCAAAKSHRVFSRFHFRLIILGLVALAIPSAAQAASVWKVTGSNGASIYLGGSVHGLLSTDYPLPSAYNHALRLIVCACDRRRRECLEENGRKIL